MNWNLRRDTRLKESKPCYGVILHPLVTNVMDFGPLGEFSCCQGEDVNGKMIYFGQRMLLINYLTVLWKTLLKLMYSCRDSLDNDIEESNAYS